MSNGNGSGKQLVYGRIAATVPVTDMDRSLHFYTDVLGLQKTFENGQPVGFVILKRDDAELHLTLASTHVASDRSVAHLIVSDAKGLHDYLVVHAVPIVKDLRDAPYGLRRNVYADPDGNRIDVGESASPPDTPENGPVCGGPARTIRPRGGARRATTGRHCAWLILIPSAGLLEEGTDVCFD